MPSFEKIHSEVLSGERSLAHKETTKDLTYNADQASSLLKVALQGDSVDQVVLAGTIEKKVNSQLKIPNGYETKSLEIAAASDVLPPIQGKVKNLTVTGDIERLQIGPLEATSVNLNEHKKGYVSFARTAQVQDVLVSTWVDKLTIESTRVQTIRLEKPVDQFTVEPDGAVDTISVTGKFQGVVTVLGEVRDLGVAIHSGTPDTSTLRIVESGKVKQLKIENDVKSVEVSGGATIDWFEVEQPGRIRTLTVENTDNDLAIQGDGTIDSLTFRGRIQGSIDLRNPPKVDVRSVEGVQFNQPVFLGDNVTLTECDFRRFTTFEQLHFLGANLFGAGQKISHTQGGEELRDSELAVIYRNLRSTFEQRSNRAEAGDFYYQEMDARRRSTSSLPAKTVLWGYWLMSGYGQRASRSVAWFFGLAYLSAWFFLINGFEPATSDQCWMKFFEALLFSIQSMVSFFSPPEGALTHLERWGQLFLRFIGPALLAQTILALRERVAR